MTRTELLALFRRHVPPTHPAGRPIPPQARDAIRRGLEAYFQSPAGQDALARAPRWHRDRPIAAVVEELLDEEREFRGVGHLGRP